MIQLYWLALGPSLSGFELHKWGRCPSCRKSFGRYGGFDRGSPPLPAPKHSWCWPWSWGSTCWSSGRQSSPGQESSAKVLLNHETPMSRKNETRTGATPGMTNKTICNRRYHNTEQLISFCLLSTRIHAFYPDTHNTKWDHDARYYGYRGYNRGYRSRGGGGNNRGRTAVSLKTCFPPTHIL